jgi:hypothetical protein
MVGAKSLFMLVVVYIGSCWYVNRFTLAISLFASLSSQGQHSTFYCYLISRLYADSLNTTCAAYIFASVLTTFVILVYPFRRLRGLTRFNLYSPNILYSLYFLLIYLGLGFRMLGSNYTPFAKKTKKEIPFVQVTSICFSIHFLIAN